MEKKYAYGSLSKVIVAAVLFAASAWVVAWATTSQSTSQSKYPVIKPIASRFDSRKAFPLTVEQRWKLDFDLVNEADMREINSRRFEVPNAYEKRSQWYEEMAQGYELADLVNQLFEFKTSSVVYDEVAFTKLFQIGKSGNVGAACMAERFYRRFASNVTVHWHIQYDDVARVASQYIDSKHPVCSELEWSLYAKGKGGLPKDLERSTRARIKPAAAGFYEAQLTMQLRHLDKVRAFYPQHVAGYLCWTRIADRQSAHAGFKADCEGYERGVAIDDTGNATQVPLTIQAIARDWCEPTRNVELQDCIDLENQLD